MANHLDQLSSVFRREKDLFTYWALPLHYLAITTGRTIRSNPAYPVLVSSVTIFPAIRNPIEGIADIAQKDWRITFPSARPAQKGGQDKESWGNLPYGHFESQNFLNKSKGREYRGKHKMGDPYTHQHVGQEYCPYADYPWIQKNFPQ